MDLDIGYHVVSADTLGDVEEFDERMSIIEFLRKVDRQEELPYDMTVYGLDDLLYGSDNTREVGRYLHKILRDNVNYLSFHNHRIQFIVDDVGFWKGEPKLTGGDDRISLGVIFRGGLTDTDFPGIFSSKLNLQS